MRKLITLFSTISLLSSSVSTIVACGVENGQKIQINFGNEPSKQTPDTDPLVDYVYNDYYKYDTNILYKPLNAFMQLASDKIRIDRSTLLENGGNVVKEFYDSDAYKSGSYESINYNYDQEKIDRSFSYQDKNGKFLVFGLTDDDMAKQQYYGYWYITYETPPDISKPPLKNHKTSIVSPIISDFKDNKDKVITRNGWIHLYFLMKDAKTNNTFRIDFNIKIDVNFSLLVDKNKKEIIVVNQTTVTKALGDVDFRHPEVAIHNRISDMTFTKL